MRDYLNLPFFILLAYSVLCFFRIPELSDAFIMIALCGLYGYKLYINTRIPRDKSLTSEQKELLKEIDTLELQKHSDAVKFEISKINSSYAVQEEAKKRNKVVF